MKYKSPSPKCEFLSVPLDSELKRLLRERAEEMDRPMASVAREILAAELKTKKKRAA